MGLICFLCISMIGLFFIMKTLHSVHELELVSHNKWTLTAKLVTYRFTDNMRPFSLYLSLHSSVQNTVYTSSTAEPCVNIITVES